MSKTYDPEIVETLWTVFPAAFSTVHAVETTTEDEYSIITSRSYDYLSESILDAATQISPEGEATPEAVAYLEMFRSAEAQLVAVSEFFRR